MCIIPLPSLLMEYLVLRILQTCSSSRFKCLFNKHSSSSRSDFLSSLRASLSNSMLLDTLFSEDDVYI